ncbi:MAG: hypothetical protein ACM3O3_08460 [Syntrophothermus sp.]
MIIFKTLLPFCLALIFISCQNNTTDPVDSEKLYKLTGVVFLNGAPLEGADVQVSAAVNWYTKTDAAGKFTINNISGGEHPVTIKKILEGKKVIGQDLTVAFVQDSTDIGQIDLPSPFGDVIIDNTQLDQSKITLSWTKSTDPNFTSYKIYRKDYSEIDNVNGEMIYETADINQTSYIDLTYGTGRVFYYRVYAYSAGNKYAGTSPGAIDIPEVNLLLNSSFETAMSDGKPEFWIERLSGNPTFNYFTVSNANVKIGNNALKIYYDDSQANPFPDHAAWGGLIQTLSNETLIKGKEYTLSFWEKSITGGYQVRISRNGNLEDNIVLYSVPSGKDWNQQKFNFKIDDSTNFIDIVISTKPSQAVGGFVEAYIDDIKIIK